MPASRQYKVNYYAVDIHEGTRLTKQAAWRDPRSDHNAQSEVPPVFTARVVVLEV